MAAGYPFGTGCSVTVRRMTDQGDEHDHHHVHGIPVAIPAEIAHAIAHGQSAARARMEDRYNTMMRWLEALDVEGLMSLRYILAGDADGAYGNNRQFDGMVVMLLRGKGVDPDTGIDPAKELLEKAAAAKPDA